MPKILRSRGFTRKNASERATGDPRATSAWAIWPMSCLARGASGKTISMRSYPFLHTMRIKAVVLSAVISVSTFGLAPESLGQLLFQDNFDSGISGFDWTVNQGGGSDSFADFAY